MTLTKVKVVTQKFVGNIYINVRVRLCVREWMCLCVRVAYAKRNGASQPAIEAG